MVASSTTQIVLFINDDEASLAVTTDTSDARLNKLMGQTFGTRIAKDENKDTELKVRCCVGEWQPREIANPDELAEILPRGSEVIRSIHVSFDASLEPCLAAPVTEIIFATAKQEQDLITFGGICDFALRATIEQPGCTGTAWGFAKENPQLFVLVAGWDRIRVRLRSFV
ncbi:hypothetical protein HWV62_9367 [Athelia sp. TMB]|nr:hypothetical protein HWV62_9367 [Athelia sp. TMB]